MIDSIGSVIGDFFGIYAGREESQESRAYGAYRDAFRSRDAELPADELGELIQQMKAHGVAGAYTNPGALPELRVYFDCWHARLEPKKLRSVMRTARKAERGPLLRRRKP